jgi:hypothetical protein
MNYTPFLVLLMLFGCMSEKPSVNDDSQIQDLEVWEVDTTLIFQDKVVEISHVKQDGLGCHLCSVDVRLRIIMPTTNEVISEVPLEVYTCWGTVNSDGFRLLQYGSEHALAYTTGDGSQGNWREFIEIFDLVTLTGKPFKKYHYLVECYHGEFFSRLPKPVQNEYRSERGGDTLNGEDWLYHKGVLKCNWKLRDDGDMEFIFDGNYYSWEPIFRSGGREFMTYNAPSYSVIQPGPWGKMKEPVSVKIKGPTGQFKIGFDDLCPYLKETLTGKFLKR